MRCRSPVSLTDLFLHNEVFKLLSMREGSYRISVLVSGTEQLANKALSSSNCVRLFAHQAIVVFTNKRSQAKVYKMYFGISNI